MAERLKPTYRNVLVHLAAKPAEAWTLANELPDGNGRKGCASGETLRKMRADGLIEYGKAPSHSLYGYRITDLGRQALRTSDGGKDA